MRYGSVLAGLLFLCAPAQAANGGGRAARSDSENPYALCIKKGYAPSDCSEMVDGRAAGQAICLLKGYPPSSCAPGRTAAGPGWCSASDNPYAVCINKGYPPSSCSDLVDGCAPGQASCLERGNAPALCAQGQRGGGGRCSASENPYAVCIARGFNPSSCSGMIDGCAAGQAACLARGFAPSACVKGRRGERPGRCASSENPYAICINKGYPPSSCSVLVDGCAAGQAACLDRGYQPSACAPADPR